MFVSHRSDLVAVYMTKLNSWGFTCGGVWVRILTLYPAGGPYICVWGFFLWRRSCVSSPPAGGGVGSY